MNFRQMPELEWKYGYGAFWGLILLISSDMVLYLSKNPMP